MRENQTSKNDVPTGTSPTIEPQQPDIPSFLKSKKAKVIGLTILVIISLLLTNTIALNKVMQNKLSIPPSPIPTPTTDLEYIKYCTQNSDCIIAINPSSCCSCPEAINKSSIEKDGWTIYQEGKNYQRPIGCNEVDCKPCQLPEKAICKNNSCTFTQKEVSNITNWKKYTNNKYNYSVKYPFEWKLGSVTGNSIEDNLKIYRQVTIDNKKVDDAIINIIVEKNPTTPILNRQWYLDRLKSIPYGVMTEKIKTEETTFQNLPALKVNDNELYFLKDRNLFHISWWEVTGYSPKSASEIFTQILSTFEFIDQTSTPKNLTTPKLIEEAFATNQISDEQRALYLTYAFYDYEKLPERFRSNQLWDGTLVLAELTNQLSSTDTFCSFSLETRTELKTMVANTPDCPTKEP